jgi:hypothetical protein
MEANFVFAGVAALILLAVTSMRYGVDGREGFASKERELGGAGSSGTERRRRRFARRRPRHERTWMSQGKSGPEGASLSHAEPDRGR